MPLITPNHSNLIKYLTNNNIAFELNADIKKLHWLKMGEGKVGIAILPEKKKQLIGVVQMLQENSSEFLVIGNGSNCYFTNNASIPILIVTTKLREVRFDENSIYTDAGVSLATFAKGCSLEGYEGFEGLVGVPGTVGAAARNNSGSFFDCEMSKIVQSVEIIDCNGTVRILRNDELAYTHRSSILKRGDLDAVIIAVNFVAVKGKSLFVIKKQVELANKRRISELEVRNKNLGAIFVGKEISPAIQNSASLRVAAWVQITRIAHRILRHTQSKLKFPATAVFFLLFLRPWMIKHVSTKAINCYIWKENHLNDKLFFSYIHLIHKILNVHLEIEIFDKSPKALDESYICEMLD